MKKTNIIYWIATALLAAVMLLSAVTNIMSNEASVKMINGELGFPKYFIPFIGVAKLLGVIAILVPGMPRLKEWAYAGLTFDLVSAAYAIVSIGSPFANWWPILIFLALLFVSYAYYHKRRKGIS